MRKYLCGLALAFCLLGTAAPAVADLQESLLNEYNASAGADSYTVNDSNVSQLQEVLSNDKVKIVCWQVAYGNYDDAYTKQLMDWVRAGGSLWFYDARLADKFGMAMYELRGEQFRGKPEKGEIGNAKMNGMAVTVMPIQSHAVGTGVASVAIFLPLLDAERNVYGSIVPSEGTVNLLQFAADSPALAALRRDGYGTVVFKPLLWEKTLSGERFQRNLIDFCAGYGVPGMGGEGRIGEILRDKKHYAEPASPAAAASPLAARSSDSQSSPDSSADIQYSDSQSEASPSAVHEAAYPSAMDKAIAEARDLYNDSGKQSAEASASSQETAGLDRFDVAGEKQPICGRISTKEIVFEGGSESYRFSPGELRSLRVGQYGNLDTVELRDGRTIKGFLLTTSFSIDTKDGVYTCKKSSLKTIDFGTETQD
ncbi:hypothetical protein IJT17_00920 [bacterium]|nr:hypothetical protein [bacterium]